MAACMRGLMMKMKMILDAIYDIIERERRGYGPVLVSTGIKEDE